MSDTTTTQPETTAPVTPVEAGARTELPMASEGCGCGHCACGEA